jgi:hypothetical protein
MKLGSSFLICYLIPVISFQRFLTSIFSSTEDPPAWARGTLATIQGRGGDLISQEALTHLTSVYDLGMFPIKNRVQCDWEWTQNQYIVHTHNCMYILTTPNMTHSYQNTPSIY